MLSEAKRKKNYESLGSFVKEKRIEAGLKQKDLADLIGLEYYTLISSIELGYTTIPPAHWRTIAKALNLDLNTWLTKCLFEMYPEIYSALFDKASRMAVAEMLNEFDEKMKRK